VKYRPEIDGLRAIAVTAVVLYHMDLGFPGGYLGVDIFFVISGFLITRILCQEMEKGQFTIAGFYERRVRRIFPALFAMLAVVLAVGWFVMLPRDYNLTMRGAVATTLFGSNVLLWYGAGYFAPASALNSLLHTWSLAVEEQFYLLFPLLLLLGYRYARNHLRTICLISALASIVAAALVAPRSPDAVFYLTPFRAWELLAGSFLALGPQTSPGNRAARELLGLAGIIAMIASVLVFSPLSGFPGNAVLAVLGAVAVIHACAAGPTLAGRLLSLRPVRYIGAISYSWYLWHWPVIVLTKFRTDLHPGPLAIAGMFAGSLLLAMASYHFVEQPFRRRRIGAERKHLFAMGAATMAATVLVGGVGMATHGMPKRFDRQTVQLDAARRPPIPYRQCLDAPKRLCMLGDQTAQPTLLVWGDSHALAWAPALDDILKRAGRSARFVSGRACPPLLGVHAEHTASCFRQNQLIESILAANSGIRTVLMIGRWSMYFTDTHAALYDDRSTVSREVASRGISRTLTWLQGKGLQTILLGDVPGHMDDVPLAMALRHAHGTLPVPARTPQDVRDRDRVFDTLAASVAERTHARLVDVVPWFCSNTSCEHQIDGKPIYRDDNHLNIEGALSRAPQLAAALGAAITPVASARAAAAVNDRH